MIADLHDLQFAGLCCQLSKAAPNILWSVGSSVHSQFLHVGRVSAAVVVAKMSLKSFLERAITESRRAWQRSETALNR
jgi:hypothetical protein